MTGPWVNPSDPPEQAYPKVYRGAIRCWRLWHLGNNRLESLVANYEWKPGENAPAPGTSWRCGLGSWHPGFYGFSSLDELRTQEIGMCRRWETVGDVAIGSILAYGRIVVASHGLRAEYAVPEYLIFPKVNDTPKLLAVAEFYNMRGVSKEEALSLRTGLVPYQISLEEEVNERD